MFQRCFVLLVCMCLVYTCEAGWLNTYDNDLNFNCPDTQFISHVKSQHDNKHEDRVFDLGCKDIIANPSELSKPVCFQTGQENDYDQLLAYQCPNNYYINGMWSHHDNHHEDRVWRFHCCEIPEIHLTDCDYTDWTNSYDNPQDFVVPAGKVMKGVTSIHNNHNEDRIFKYELCSAIEGGGSEVVG